MSIITRFFREFLRTESASGILMTAATLMALIWVNVPLNSFYLKIINSPLTFTYGPFGMSQPIHVWINELLMMFFFLLIAMELKREIVVGTMLSRDQLYLAMTGALGGIIVPAAAFLLFNYGHAENIVGWAIPTATDTAFALCVLLMVGKSVPAAAKIFLLAMTIFDDLGAILIVGLFYTHGFSLLPCLLAAVIIIAMFVMNRRGVGSHFVYMILMFALWYAFHRAGIHTTVAGAVTAAFIPLKDSDNHHVLNDVIVTLHPWVAFMVLPLFAFVNAGFDMHGLTQEMLFSPLTIGIIFGLFAGKQVGIMLLCWIGVRICRFSMPEGLNWKYLYAVAIVSGIGFTMSILIGSLTGFNGALEREFKAAIIIGSCMSAIWGFAYLKWLERRPAHAAAADESTAQASKQ